MDGLFSFFSFFFSSPVWNRWTGWDLEGVWQLALKKKTDYYPRESPFLLLLLFATILQGAAHGTLTCIHHPVASKDLTTLSANLELAERQKKVEHTMTAAWIRRHPYTRRSSPRSQNASEDSDQILQERVQHSPLMHSWAYGNMKRKVTHSLHIAMCCEESA